jgi:hypothetical protein
MHKFKTNDQNKKGSQISGLAFRFGRDAIELILKIKILIEKLIE